ncbi:MAG: hypothetical protein VYB22_04770, partial [Pseudomonadota bacterium]|nr:hypothetical protein [Pseudomonadota bacterium]
MTKLKTLMAIMMLCLTACAGTEQTTLYDKLGGEAGVDKIVNNLVQNNGRAEQKFHYFSEANLKRLREHL